MTPGFKPFKIVICVCKSPEMSMMTGLLQKKKEPLFCKKYMKCMSEVIFFHQDPLYICTPCCFIQQDNSSIEFRAMYLCNDKSHMPKFIKFGAILKMTRKSFFARRHYRFSSHSHFATEHLNQ